MGKKMCMLLCTILLLGLFLTGCGIEASFNIAKDGKLSLSSDLYLNAEEYAEMLLTGAKASDFTKVKLDGKTYFKAKQDQSTEDAFKSAMDEMGDELKKELTAKECVMPFGSSTDSTEALEDSSLGGLGDLNTMLESIDFYNMSITFPYKVILTNGTLSEDGKTVTFNLMELMKNKADSIYAYTAKSTRLIELAKTDGTTIKNKAKVAAKKIKIATYDKVKSITVNGKAQKSKTIKLAKDTTYKIKVVTANASKTFTVTRDTKKPTVTGVKNKKTYSKKVTIKFSDSASGIASATLNDKKFKSGKSVSKAGKYTLKVTDKAGNTTTIKFTIK